MIPIINNTSITVARLRRIQFINYEKKFSISFLLPSIDHRFLSLPDSSSKTQFNLTRGNVARVSIVSSLVQRAYARFIKYASKHPMEVAFYEDNNPSRQGKKEAGSWPKGWIKLRDTEEDTCVPIEELLIACTGVQLQLRNLKRSGIVAGFESLAVISRDLISAATVRFFSLGSALVKSLSPCRFFAYFLLFEASRLVWKILE